LDTLREPFDEDVITTNDDGFSNVAPVHYIQRLINSGLKYEILPGALQYNPNGSSITVSLTLSLTIDGTNYSFGGFGEGDSASAAESVALKRAMLKIGVGIDLYTNDVEVKKKTKYTPKAKAKAAPEDEDEEDEAPKKAIKKRSSWTGEDEITGGAHKGETWAEQEGSFLAWIIDKMDAGSPFHNNATKEIERRGDDFDPEEGAKPKQKAYSPRSGAKPKAGRFS